MAECIISFDRLYKYIIVFIAFKRDMLRLLVITGLLLTKHGLFAEEESVTYTVQSTESVAENTDITTETPHIDRSSDHHYHPHVHPTFQGFWKKKLIWRPRWMKTWQEKKVYVAVWKRMWGPAVLNEWVPVPKPPPGWLKHDFGGFAVKRIPH